MMIIFFRIILTWFTGIGNSRVQEILEQITDPYLDWFRRFTFLRAGFLDLSPIAALGVLSLVNRILNTLAIYGKISIGIILVLVLQALWGAVSFILGFLIIVLIIRLIGLLLKQNTQTSFWSVIDTIAQPILFRINRVVFKNRIINFKVSVFISAAVLGLGYLILRTFVFFLSVVLAGMPF
jgi:YggT family protein